MSLASAGGASGSLPGATQTAQTKQANLEATYPDVPAPPLPNGASQEFAIKAMSAPRATGPEAWFKLSGGYALHNVTQPTLTVFLPPAGKANGSAVVIAPGGGFLTLSMSSEGWDVARWLASQGITAFVLKYRTLATPPTGAEVMQTFVEKVGAKEPFPSSAWFLDGKRMAVEDGKEALRVVRANAAKWQIDPKKVGFMGFSAGGFTTVALAESSDIATMPAFIAPVYGPTNTPDKPLPKGLPPMWAAFAADDPIVGKTDFGLLNAWRAAGSTVEFHLHDKGSHGYGFAGVKGTTTVDWPNYFLDWLRVHGFAR